jgi:hypothetical protein
VFSAVTIATGDPSGDFYLLALWTELWGVLTITVAFAVFTVRGVVGLVRHFKAPA